MLADERLVERLIKLFYWPAKMSATAPAEQEVLFLGDEEDSEMCSRDSAVAAVDNPFVSSSSSSSHLPVKLKNQVTAKCRRARPLSGRSETTLDDIGTKWEVILQIQKCS